VTVERELKLLPEQPGLLDLIAARDHLGPLRFGARHLEKQMNAFYDTPDRALGNVLVAFRRRTNQGAPMATWALKMDGEMTEGLITRSEIEVALDHDTPPFLALSLLRQAASERGALVLAEKVADALTGSSPVQAEPFLRFDTERTAIALEEHVRGWLAELALDRVRLLPCGHGYEELEVELKRGDEELLAIARAEIQALGPVVPGTRGKLDRAIEHLAEHPR
jgi:inorganic triphosphatase YgiF